MWFDYEELIKRDKSERKRDYILCLLAVIGTVIAYVLDYISGVWIAIAIAFTNITYLNHESATKDEYTWLCNMIDKYREEDHKRIEELESTVERLEEEIDKIKYNL